MTYSRDSTSSLPQRNDRTEIQQSPSKLQTWPAPASVSLFYSKLSVEFLLIDLIALVLDPALQKYYGTYFLPLS